MMALIGVSGWSTPTGKWTQDEVMKGFNDFFGREALALLLICSQLYEEKILLSPTFKKLDLMYESEIR